MNRCRLGAELHLLRCGDAGRGVALGRRDEGGCTGSGTWDHPLRPSEEARNFGLDYPRRNWQPETWDAIVQPRWDSPHLRGEESASG